MWQVYFAVMLYSRQWSLGWFGKTKWLWCDSQECYLRGNLNCIIGLACFLFLLVNRMNWFRTNSKFGPKSSMCAVFMVVCISEPGRCQNPHWHQIPKYLEYKAQKSKLSLWLCIQLFSHAEPYGKQFIIIALMYLSIFRQSWCDAALILSCASWWVIFSVP